MKNFFQVDEKFTNPFFVATVENNRDPDFNYRVKVRIPYLHDTIQTSDLPWAARVDTAFMGIGDNSDLDHKIPEVGTQVLVLAVGDDINSLVYLGCLYKRTAQTPTGAAYTDTYGIYRKDGQFIGINKIQKLFQLLFNGNIEINKVTEMIINVSGTVNLSASTVNIDTSTTNINSGTINIAGGNVTIDGTLKAGNIAGANQFCTIAVCPLTGAPHKAPSTG